MVQRFRLVLIGILITTGTGISFPVQADNLMQVYHQALKNDPVYAQAISTWQAAKLDLPIAWSSFLPDVSTSANADRNYTRSVPKGSLDGYGSAYGYSLTVTQPIFDVATWESIRNAGATVKAATATYLAAQESLMMRTATAYFDVLQAADRLRYTVANKRAVWQQLETSKQKFKVGLIAITDVYDARSRYDQVVAAQITAQNNLNIQLENLRAITGSRYKVLMGLGKQLPLLPPVPNDVNRWVSIATKQNYGLIAQNYTTIAAMDTVKQQFAGNYPTIEFEGNIADAYVAHNAGNPLGTTSTDSGKMELVLSYDPVQGGLVSASIQQARDNYVTASGKLEQTHREVVNQIRSGFLSVLSGISQIKAGKQQILSARNALAATEAGFRVGTRTMVDVLNDLTTMYQAQQKYADDQYDYINNLISLKEAAGTLTVADLEQINTWMQKRIKFPEELAKVKSGHRVVPDKSYSDQQAPEKKISPGNISPKNSAPIEMPLSNIPPKQMQQRKSPALPAPKKIMPEQTAPIKVTPLKLAPPKKMPLKEVRNRKLLLPHPKKTHL